MDRKWKVLVTRGTQPNMTYAHAATRADAEALRQTAIRHKYPDARVEEVHEETVNESPAAIRKREAVAQRTDPKAR